MKPFYFLLVFALFLFSCDKEETPDPEIPEWMEVKIQELESPGQNCEACQITKFTFNNEYYYHFYCSYSSCAYCNFYNSDGQLVNEIEEFSFEDFFESDSDETVIWSCPDSN